MRVALAMIQDASEVLTPLLEGGHSKVAGRLAGAFRNIGNDKIANQIIKTMRAADFTVHEEDPFEAAAIYQPPPRERSPYVNRLRLMWQEMREHVTGENPGAVTDTGHSDWYQELFGPSVTAGILKPADLAGYRNDRGYIRNSLHTPPRVQAVRECMPVLFDLLREETKPSVSVVLGHFVFVYIHPYMDGNGRMGRFLMNAMLAGGGYPWTVIPVESREAYMQALEQASVYQNIVPFTEFLAELVEKSLSE
jgi:hypothetical protein